MRLGWGRALPSGLSSPTRGRCRLNRNLIRHEFSKIFGNPIFAFTLILATAISIAAAIEAWWTLKAERELLSSFGYGVGLQAKNYLGQTRESSFGNWIVVSANAPLSASVFFYTLPLLTMLAGSWSYLSEHLSGYEAQICTRVSRKAYVNAKMVSAFLSAFAVTAIPLLMNFLIVSILFPAYLPRVDESTYVGLYLHSYFSSLFYSRPLLYVLAYTLFDAVTLGALSVAVAGLTAVFHSKIKAVVVPYLLMVAWHFANDWIFRVILRVGFNFNILNSIRSESLNNWPDIRAGFVEIILLLSVSLIFAGFLKRREVV